MKNITIIRHYQSDPEQSAKALLVLLIRAGKGPRKEVTECTEKNPLPQAGKPLGVDSGISS